MVLKQHEKITWKTQKSNPGKIPNYNKRSSELPYDPAIPLLGIHTKETRIETDTCTTMFIAALFIIVRTWKQRRCPSADEWIRKQCRRPGFNSWVGKIPLEKGEATHASILAWEIPWTEEPDRPQSTGSQRVGKD